MAVGWAKDGAVQEQIDASVADAVTEARSQLNSGASLSHCEACDALIPMARRQAVPGVKLCIHCQAEHEQQAQHTGTINRRGSKDSQLR